MSPRDPNRRSILLSAAAISGLVTSPAVSRVETAVPQSALLRSQRSTQVEASSFDEIEIEVHDSVALMGLKGMTSATLEKILFVFESINQNPAIAAVVIYSLANDFWSGLETEKRNSASAHATTWSLMKPSIIVVHGEISGLAYNLLLPADVRIACADARFTHLDALASNKAITTTLIEDIGRANAKRYLLSGDTFGAHEAFRMGLIQDILPTREEAVHAAAELARHIGRNASLRSS